MEAPSSENAVPSEDPPPSRNGRPALQNLPGLDTSEIGELKQAPHWNDWRWQMRNRIRTVPHLLRFFPELRGQADLVKVVLKYPMAITPYYASLIRHADISDPVFQMAVPQMEEMFDPPFLHADPLEEEEDMPVPGLIHRYRDRALVMATTTCSMYCRHCTRKRVAGTRESAMTATQLDKIVAYLREHPEIKDVIISGGDPFTLSMDVLERILSAIHSVESVDIIRIGTRTPVVMPMRISDELVAMLKKYHPVWVNTHFNHPVEVTAEAIAACTKLANAGIPMGNQSVLLRGINDDPHVMEQLCRALVKARVRPYYMFQCDLVRGVEHFRTPISRGLQIMEYLRGRLSGLAIPDYVVDAPHGGGKVPILPNYVVSASPTHTVLRNFEGMMVNYPEPGARIDRSKHDDAVVGGVWELTTGRTSGIVPQESGRTQRRKQRSKTAGVKVPALAAKPSTSVPAQPARARPAVTQQMMMPLFEVAK